MRASVVYHVDEDQFIYTFSGYQGSNSFSIQVVACSEQEARDQALKAVKAEARKQLAIQFEKESNFEKIMDIQSKMAKVTYDGAQTNPIEENIGRYCHHVWSFFEPIFTDPTQNIGQKWISFDQWITVAKCEKKEYNPNIIRIYSC